MILINIITITFNSEKYLEQTILSVINQDYKNINYIIIDGASKDSTLDIINKYKEHINVVVSEPDKGIADAFNKGLKYCNEGLVGFLNSDDFFKSNKSVSIIANNFVNDNTILCGSLSLIDEELNEIRELKSRPRLLPFGMYLLHPTMYVPFNIFNKTGLFNLDYKIAIDYDWTIRAVKNNAKFKVINENIISMRVGGASRDTDKVHQEEKQIRKIHYRSNILNIVISIYQILTAKLTNLSK